MVTWPLSASGLFSTQMTQNSKQNKWLEILAGEDFLSKTPLENADQNSSRAETKTTTTRITRMTSLSTAKETSSTQRPQTCTKVATNHNYTANETGEEREHRLPTLQKPMRRSVNAWSLQSKLSFQRTEDSRSAFKSWSTMGFTVSFILQ